MVNAAFDTWLFPLLGIIFLPFATLIYVVLYTPGVGLTGWEWFWVVFAALLDVGFSASRALLDHIGGLATGAAMPPAAACAATCCVDSAVGYRATSSMRPVKYAAPDHEVSPPIRQ